MSFNRCEQRIYDYLQRHPDERQYWLGKVQNIATRHPDGDAAAARIEGELWRYYEERSAVASPFREAARIEGLGRVSMRNLSEHLLRLWMAPKPPKKDAGSPGPGDAL